MCDLFERSLKAGVADYPIVTAQGLRGAHAQETPKPVFIRS